MSRANDCNLCHKEVNFEEGGCALQLAFCRGHSTTLTNISFCGECFKALLEKPLKNLADSACITIDFGDELEEEPIE